MEYFHAVPILNSSISGKIIGALLLLLLSQSASADSITGRVVKVADGDTVTILDNTNIQHKIRLLGIDAPERKQAFGTRSQQALSEDVFDKTVEVDWNKRDRYRRIVGKILINGQDVNLKQVQRGMAWHYKKYESEQDVADRSVYAQAEYQAQRERVGLWTDKDPLAPWDFRKTVK